MEIRTIFTATFLLILIMLCVFFDIRPWHSGKYKPKHPHRPRNLPMGFEEACLANVTCKKEFLDKNLTEGPIKVFVVPYLSTKGFNPQDYSLSHASANELRSLLTFIKENPSQKLFIPELYLLDQAAAQTDESFRSLVEDLIKSEKLEVGADHYLNFDEGLLHYKEIINELSLANGLRGDLGADKKSHTGWNLKTKKYSSSATRLQALSETFYRVVKSQSSNIADNGQPPEGGLQFLWQNNISSYDENAVLTVVEPMDFYKLVTLMTGSTFKGLNNVYEAPNTAVSTKDLKESDYNKLIPILTELTNSQVVPYFIIPLELGFDVENKMQELTNLESFIENANKINSTERGLEFSIGLPDKVFQSFEYSIVFYPNHSHYELAIPAQGTVADYNLYTDEPRVTGYLRNAMHFIDTTKKVLGLSVWKADPQSVGLNLGDALNEIKKFNKEISILHDPSFLPLMQGKLQTQISKMNDIRTKLVQDVVFSRMLSNTKGKAKGFVECTFDREVLCDVSHLLESDKSVLVAVYNPSPKRNQKIQIRVPSAFVEVTKLGGPKLLDANVQCYNIIDIQGCALYLEDQFAAYSTTFYKISKSFTSLEQRPSYQGSEEKTIETKSGGLTQKLTIQPSTATFSYSVCEYTNCAEGTFTLSYRYYSMQQLRGGIHPPERFSAPHAYKIYQKSSDKTDIVIVLEADLFVTTVNIYENILNGVEIITYTKFQNIDKLDDAQSLILYVQTDITNEGFSTDLNGLQERKWNNLVSGGQLGDGGSTLIPSNYRLASSFLTIEGSGRSATVFLDRASGVTSIEPGTLEICLVGDIHNGQNAVEGNDILKFKNVLLIENNLKTMSKRAKQLLVEQPVSLYFTEAGVIHMPPSPREYPTLDENVQLFVEIIGEKEILIGFLNLDSKNPVEVSNKVFKSMGREPKKIEETNLAGSETKEALCERKPAFNRIDKQNKPALTDYQSGNGSFTLKPLEARVFKITI